MWGDGEFDERGSCLYAAAQPMQGHKQNSESINNEAFGRMATTLLMIDVALWGWMMKDEEKAMESKTRNTPPTAQKPLTCAFQPIVDGISG